MHARMLRGPIAVFALAIICGIASWAIFGGTLAALAAGPLLVDGSFEVSGSGQELRAREDPQGWYESRSDTKDGRLQLMLSTKDIAGNTTKKAMIKANEQFNTYLSQLFSTPQRGQLTMQWDICVHEILPSYNRSAFQMIGNAATRGRGPNATGKERFVFLGFENAPRPGKINLIAFEGKDPSRWDAKRALVSNLDIDKWYTIRVAIDVPKKVYRVEVEGVTTSPIEVAAYRFKNEVPDVLTHISFASWNDGPGTFYVDNVVTR